MKPKRVLFSNINTCYFLKLLLLLAILMLQSSCFNEKDIYKKEFKYVVKQTSMPDPVNTAVESNFFVDINDDGTDEMIQSWNRVETDQGIPNAFIIHDLSGTHHLSEQIDVQGKIGQIKLFKDPVDLSRKLIFFEQLKSELYLNVFLMRQFTPVQERRWPITDIPFPAGDENHDVAPITLLDWNRDGSADLIVRVHTGYSYQPRGIWIIDLSTGSTLLKKQVGQGIAKIAITDIDGDRLPEIICGGSAYNNYKDVPPKKRFVDGMDDSNSRLLIIDDTGEYMVNDIYGGPSSDTFPYLMNLDGDGTSEMLLVINETLDKAVGTVGFRSLHSKILSKDKKRLQLALSPVVPFDFQNDETTEFFILWADGLGEVRNAENEVVASQQFPIKKSSHVALTDIDTDGSSEICIWNSTGLVLLNSNLEIIAFKPFDIQKLDIVSPGLVEKKYFRILSEGKASDFYLAPNMRRFLQPIITFVSLLLGTLITLVVIIHTQQRKRRMELISMGSLPNVAMLVLHRKGEIANFSRNVHSLLGDDFSDSKGKPIFELKNSVTWKAVTDLIEDSIKTRRPVNNREMVISSKGEQRHFLITFFPFRKGLFFRRFWDLQFIEITEVIKSKRAIAWAGMAQRLAHELKTPLSSVMLAAQQLQSSLERTETVLPKSEEYLHYIIDQVHRMRNTTDAFMKFARLTPSNLQPENINRAIDTCLNELKTSLPDSVAIKKQMQDELPPILIDCEEMNIALKNIFENAFNAMKGQGTLTIVTRLEQLLQSGEETVVIEISDTGSGISEEDLEKIFEPFYSRSKEGTGLGLTFVKKIIDAHHGRIEYESAVDIGTTVTIKLPTQTKE